MGYQQRMLLKSMLRAIALASYAPTTTRPRPPVRPAHQQVCAQKRVAAVP